LLYILQNKANTKWVKVVTQMMKMIRILNHSIGDSDIR